MKTEAENKAQKKYMNKIRHTTKAQLNATLNTVDYDIIENYCKGIDISKTQFIVNAIKYCIENDIDFKNKEDTSI